MTKSLKVSEGFLKVFQNKVICKKAVSKRWCKESRLITVFLIDTLGFNQQKTLKKYPDKI